MGKSKTSTLPSAGGRRIVLAGNPNVGKSVFFGSLTGMYVEVSNYPGTTVEISRGEFGEFQILDTPGIYGVSSFNDEERVARDIILGADGIINVIDACHLERDLFLTHQLIDMGKPVLVALNFMDEAEKAGLKIDIKSLQELLGVDVVPTVAIRGEGLDMVKDGLRTIRPGRRNMELEEKIKSLSAGPASQAERLLILEGDPFVAERNGIQAMSDEREGIYLDRRRRTDSVIQQVIRDVSTMSTFSERLGRAAINPLTGIPIMAAVLWALYRVIGVWVAGDIVGLTEETLMQGYYEPWIRGVFSRFTLPSSAFFRISVGEFGLLSMTFTYLLGLLLPLVLGFYFFLSLLEDTGYLPRLATLVDRLMTFVGLNGRAVVPIILGFGCVQVGTITTRLLGTEREKSITTALLNFAIPCSAQIGVIAGMLAAVGGRLVFLYGAVIFIVIVILGTVLNRMLPGTSSDLVLNLPPLRLPRPGNVARKAVTRSWFFMKEAVPWFFLGSLLVSVLQVSGGLKWWQRLLAPVTEGWLQIPGEAATAFVMGMVRRDFGAAGLTELSMDPLQVVVSLIVITLFVPCIASLMILFKERGTREAMTIWAGSWAAAFAVGGVVSQLLI